MVKEPLNVAGSVGGGNVEGGDVLSRKGDLDFWAGGGLEGRGRGH